jgi:hypothetical protein
MKSSGKKKPRRKPKERHSCPGCPDEGNPPHECPFAAEIHGDDSLCECCDLCTQSCAMDI